MITADTLRQCAYLSTPTLEKLIKENHPEDRIVTSEFLGITNGRQFCYGIKYPDEHESGQLSQGKVFVWQNDSGKLVADY